MTKSASRARRRTISCPSALAQIDRDRLLVARLHVPPQRRALMEQPPLAQWIAPRCTVGSRRFHLDHFGAELGEHLSRERAGNQLSQLQDLEPGQRPWRQTGRFHAGLSDKHAPGPVRAFTGNSTNIVGEPRWYCRFAERAAPPRVVAASRPSLRRHRSAGPMAGSRLPRARARRCVRVPCQTP